MSLRSALRRLFRPVSRLTLPPGLPRQAATLQLERLEGRSVPAVAAIPIGGLGTDVVDDIAVLQGTGAVYILGKFQSDVPVDAASAG